MAEAEVVFMAGELVEAVSMAVVLAEAVSVTVVSAEAGFMTEGSIETAFVTEAFSSDPISSTALRFLDPGGLVMTRTAFTTPTAMRPPMPPAKLKSKTQPKTLKSM